MKFLFVFVLTLASASTYEIAIPLKDLVIDELAEGRITNGQPADNGQFPYQVSLTIFLSRDKFGYCGGSIISSQYILTAAHCTNGAISGTAYYGSTIRNGGKSVTFNKDSIIQHAGFNPITLNNDISLIKVSLTLGGAVAAIGLPARSSSYSTYDSKYALISGFGRTTNNGPVSNTLNWARSQIISNIDCKKSYAAGVINDGTICISTPDGISTCMGDSGGPLALEGANELVGITSFTSKWGCTMGVPSGFARVTYFRDWIYNNSGI